MPPPLVGLAMASNRCRSMQMVRMARGASSLKMLPMACPLKSSVMAQCSLIRVAVRGNTVRRPILAAHS